MVRSSCLEFRESTGTCWRDDSSARYYDVQNHSINILRGATFESPLMTAAHGAAIGVFIVVFMQFLNFDSLLRIFGLIIFIGSRKMFLDTRQYVIDRGFSIYLSGALMARFIVVVAVCTCAVIVRMGHSYVSNILRDVTFDSLVGTTAHGVAFGVFFVVFMQLLNFDSLLRTFGLFTSSDRGRCSWIPVKMPRSVWSRAISVLRWLDSITTIALPVAWRSAC